MNNVLRYYLTSMKTDILIAEDNQIMRKLLSRQIESLGYKAHAVANGKLAVEAASKKQYKLILMDVQMSTLDGIAATKLIREQEQQGTHRAAIIAITANANRAECIEAGMDGYFQKPVLLEDIRRMLAVWVDGPEYKLAAGSNSTREDLVFAGLNDTKPALLRFLASSPLERIRERVAENPATPASVLRLLCHDPSENVRTAAAENSNLPWDALRVLAADGNPDVRFAVAANPHLPVQLLGSLRDDENPYVSHRAEQTVATLPKLDRTEVYQQIDSEPDSWDIFGKLRNLAIECIKADYAQARERSQA